MEDQHVIARFFVDRPIFATVISLVIMLAGGVAVFTLPIAQYPDVTPPTVQVIAYYPGANATTVRDTVAAPIEEQVSGVEGMMYMSSRCTNDGRYTLTVTFKLGTDSDMAQVLVQNRVSLALPVIPPLVQSEGITVKKMSPNTMMMVNLISKRQPAATRTRLKKNLYLSNYATIDVRDELGRLPGVAGVGYIGQRDYSLRAWLDPNKLAALKLSRDGRHHGHRPAKRSGCRRSDRSKARSQRAAVSVDDYHARPSRGTGAVRKYHRQERCGHHHRHRPGSHSTGSSGSSSASTAGGLERRHWHVVQHARAPRPPPPCRPPASSGCATS